MATKDISVIRDKKTGDIKNIRDKEIKDAKAKTAVAQTDAVRMKTVDDKEVYIDRNSLVQAIAEVMNSNSQSTIQTLFGADANGNHANINMANLASVLSAAEGLYHKGANIANYYALFYTAEKPFFCVLNSYSGPRFFASGPMGSYGTQDVIVEVTNSVYKVHLSDFAVITSVMVFSTSPVYSVYGSDT